MTNVFRPMLAVACEDLSKVRYPCWLSEKLDGIRAIVFDGVVYSRSMKPIPSRQVQEKFGKPEYEGFDGEIIYGNKHDKDVFNNSTRVCMNRELPEEFDYNKIKFYVFDKVDFGKSVGYYDRYTSIITGFPDTTGVQRLKIYPVDCVEQIQELEAMFLASGAEGVMLRSYDGLYKQGRSTLKEGYLLKVKQFVDDEATIIGFEELMHNENVAEVSETGYTKRSSSKDGLVGANTLGALLCECNGIKFSIGTGFDAVTRKTIWDNRDQWVGKLVKFKHFPIGAKDSFRFPTFIGLRPEFDI